MYSLKICKKKARPIFKENRFLQRGFKQKNVGKTKRLNKGNEYSFYNLHVAGAK